jgi:DNA modification methylase
MIINGNCLDVMRTMDAQSVQTCITSPPYYGLRDYGTATWDGGDSYCNHVDDVALAERLRQKKSMISVGERIDGSTRTRVHDEQIGNTIQHRDVCPKCGAKRIDAQLGLEATPDQYVTKMVSVFREVRRILRDDGTVWLNLGDSYAHNVKEHNTKSDKQSSNRGTKEFLTPHRNFEGVGIKTKDLIGIPWRVAFALQSDGWYLRQDIIWSKPNPMPESVTDRCTKSHEYIFLLSKSQKYYFDHEAIQEPAIQSDLKRSAPRAFGAKVQEGTHRCDVGNTFVDTDTRNKRSVWTVNVHPYSGAHFATFPPKLIEPCVLAGCPVGGTVFDPFTGSGTTGAVALKHHRKFIGCELNAEYVKLATARIESECTMFNQEMHTQTQDAKHERHIEP